jgi:hypothetical protein
MLYHQQMTVSPQAIAGPAGQPPAAPRVSERPDGCCAAGGRHDGHDLPLACAEARLRELMREMALRALV